MADNRNAGEDSRQWGPVPHARIMGRPVWVYWSTDADGHLRWSRVGLRLR
jgi:signal peptidase I